MLAVGQGSPQLVPNGNPSGARQFDDLVEDSRQGKNPNLPRLTVERRTIPEEKDVQAWQEIERQRGQGKSYNQIFSESVKAGNLEIVGAMIRMSPEGFDINQSGPVARTALHDAVFANNNAEAMVKLLVNEGKIDIARLDSFGRSAYQLAAGGKTDTTKAIAEFLKSQLDGGAIAAALQGDTKRVDALVAAGAAKPATSGASNPAPKPASVTPIGPVTAETKRPAGDTRSAQEIIKGSKLLSNLSAEDKKALKRRVGDFENDADAAFRAVAVLNHIENFDEDGNIRIGNREIGDGKINGWTKDKEARHGTEAGRFQDFIKYGYSNLKGNSRPDGMPPTAEDSKPAENAPPTKPVVNGPVTADTKRPENDKRSAKEIIAGSGVLRNLSAVDKEALKRRVGDFENDADAAYRAVAVLNHIQHFDEDGNLLKDPKDNGRIEGWTREDRNDPKSEAQHGTEAGRFQDFIKYGYSSLKGQSKPDGRPVTSPAPSTTLSMDTKRPSGDTRTAAEILRTSPVIANLAEQDKKALKAKIGDFENDADAAYRAVMVLGHIESFDENGQQIFGSSVGNGRIDGWTQERTNSRTGKPNPASEARHGTEAGRFQDFIKYGFSSLKGDFKIYNAPTDSSSDFKSEISRLDFRNEQTSEESNGQKLTVQQLALKNMLQDYKQKVEKGEIKEGSQKYKFYQAMLAQGALSNGQNLLTHFEQQWAGSSGTTRDNGSNNFQASPGVMGQIVNADQVEKNIQESLADPEVAKDFNSALFGAATKVPGLNLEQRQQELRTLLTSDAFQKHFKQLSTGTDEQKEQATVEFQQLFSSYATLAGDNAANELGAEIARLGVATELDQLLQNPDEVDPQYWLAATSDFITSSLGWATTSGILEQSTLAMIDQIKTALANKDFQKGFAEIMQKYATLSGARPGGAPGKAPELSPELAAARDKEVNDLKERVLKDPSQREAISKFFHDVNKTGFMDMATGFIALASGIRRLVKNEGFTDDPQKNLGMANGLMFYLATVDQQVKFADLTSRFTGINKYLGMGNTSSLFAAGSLQEMYNVKPDQVWKDQIDRGLKSLDNEPPKVGPPSNVRGSLAEILARKFGGPDAPATDLKLKLGVGAARLLSSSMFGIFGVLAMASAGIGLKKAKTPEDKALAGLNFVAGVAWTATGGIWTATQFNVATRILAPWISRLGAIGIFVSAISSIVAEILTERKANKQQVDFFKDLEKQGLLKEGWGDKLEFITLYGYSKNAPNFYEDEGGTIFDKYDWKKWLSDYKEQNKGHNGTSPRVPELQYSPGFKPAKDADNSLNAAVANIQASIGDGKGVPKLQGDLRKHVKDLMEFYLVHRNRNATADEAAMWAMSQIRERIGGTGSKDNYAVYNWFYSGGSRELKDIANEIIETRPDILLHDGKNPEDAKREGSEGEGGPAIQGR